MYTGRNQSHNLREALEDETSQREREREREREMHQGARCVSAEDILEVVSLAPVTPQLKPHRAEMGYPVKTSPNS